MITEDYCSYEITKLLKEKGFDGETLVFISEDGFLCDYTLVGFLQYEMLPCPTHQMAIKFLRENKGLFISIVQQIKCTDSPIKYYFSIWKDARSKMGDTGPYSTYEEAIEAALKYTLNYLL